MGAAGAAPGILAGNLCLADMGLLPADAWVFPEVGQMVMEAREIILEALLLPRAELARVAAEIDAELFTLSMEDGNL